MSFATKEAQKAFIDALQEIRKRMEELDDLILNPQEEPIFDRDLLNFYGMLVREICALFTGGVLHVFFQSSDDTQIIDGVMSIRDNRDNIRLQFIRLPIDPLTVAGYTFLKGKPVNVVDIYASEPPYADLNPLRNKVIDEKLGQKTKESLSCPIFEPDSNAKIIGVVSICNQEDHQAFDPYLERGLSALATVLAKSFRKGGLYTRLLYASKNSGKAGYVTSLLQGQDDEDSELSIDDLLSKALAATPSSGGKPTGASSSSTQTLKKVDPASLFSPTATQTLKKVDSKPVAPTATQTLKKADGKSLTSATTQQVKKADLPSAPAEAPKAAPKNTTAASPKAHESSSISSTMVREYEPPSMSISGSLLVDEIEEKLEKMEKERVKEHSVDHYVVSVDLRGEHYDSRYSYLVKHKIIKEDDLKHAIAIAKKDNRPADDVLEQKFKVPRLEIGKSLSAHYGYPYFPYSDRFDRPTELLGNIKNEFFEKQMWLPITTDINPPKPIVVVSPDPIRAESMSIAQFLPRPQFRLMVTTSAEFQLFFNNFFSGDQMNKMLRDLEAQQAQEIEEDINDSASTAISEDDLVKLVNRIITEAYTRRASDIHIEPYPGNQKTMVRFRIDGELMEFVKLSSNIRQRVVNRIKIMADLNISEQRIPQDGKIKMSRFTKTMDIELRVATYPVAGGNNLNLEDVVMRILASGEPLPLEKLGLREHARKGLLEAIHKPYGIIFVCGPTGSGKTTTLHSLLKELNTPGIKIVTAEDPVEITQNGLRQMQINHAAGMSFAAAMRSFLRADPDVIMVGEMRDEETVRAGVEASLTGHLVMSTLHTNSAPEAVTRLIDMGMDPLSFADSMLAILAQRLAKKLCQECRVPYTPDAEELDLLMNEYIRELLKVEPWKSDPASARKQVLEKWHKDFAKDGLFTLYKPKGCPSCNEGYKGRIGLYELLLNSDSIKLAVKHRAEIEEVMEICLREGMDTLKMDGISKILLGLTDLKQVLTVCIK